MQARLRTFRETLQKDRRKQTRVGLKNSLQIRTFISYRQNEHLKTFQHIPNICYISLFPLVIAGETGFAQSSRTRGSCTSFVCSLFAHDAFPLRVFSFSHHDRRERHETVVGVMQADSELGWGLLRVFLQLEPQHHCRFDDLPLRFGAGTGSLQKACIEQACLNQPLKHLLRPLDRPP